MNILNLALKVLPINKSSEAMPTRLFGRSCHTYVRVKKMRTEMPRSPVSFANFYFEH